MDMRTVPGRDFRHGGLIGGGCTRIPPEVREPWLGVGRHRAAIPEETVATLRSLAEQLELPLPVLLLAAHAKVLAALSGEREVVTGYVAEPGRPPVPCRLTLEPRSWRETLRRIGRIEAEARAHAHVARDELRPELGRTDPLFATVFDPTGTQAAFADGAQWEVSFRRRANRHVLRLCYRNDALDAATAARIAGYHVTALKLMATDPDAEHGLQSLLSPGELRFQLEGLAGPRRALPDRRAHELFEERVRQHPERVAAVQGSREWTYAELNSRANQLGRALLARGLRREDVVAVVTERNLNWLAAVLAIFKAGGAYLPIEPHFPADRIATTLRRAGCRLVLTESGSNANLDRALDSLPGVRELLLGNVYAQSHPDGDLGVDVSADQLAYIYFTSGSTGVPKGVMCEHAGMVNHLLAKIDDLSIGEGQVVAQTAPQCFDISLWQLVSALLVGGRTLLVDQEVVLDVPRWVTTIVEGRASVVQVVPSYLEAVLAYLEQHPHQLPDLRCVSVTGEALKKELTQRWFAIQPVITLANAYGLTETSDDTNHEVMKRVPDGDRVPLGHPVNNVHVYVVDEHLSPVPYGAPGEIVFSGVCVGRGYVNDPERTRLAFTTDPHRPGQRLYRSGDHGRWRPDGKLEFLGRRDSQVKISGFRIEIGEIENTLLRAPGVRDAAVIVAERDSGNRHLVAFYSAGQPLDADLLRRRLGASLPHYMVPTDIQWVEQLPLTANSKIDKKALAALARELDVIDADVEAPRTPAERKVAAAWATVLGVAPDQIGRQDNFFDRGGSSLSAVKLVVALNRAVSLQDVIRVPVLTDLAELIHSCAASRPVSEARTSHVDHSPTPAV